jgi:chromosome partitioning protein
VFKAIIPRSVRLAEAPSHGLPVAVYSPNSTGAAAYRALAEELLNADQPNPPASTMTEAPGESDAG